MIGIMPVISFASPPSPAYRTASPSSGGATPDYLPAPCKSEGGTLLVTSNESGLIVVERDMAYLRKIRQGSEIHTGKT